MKKNKENYSIGLDIGTNSVGWSVTDGENNIIKFNSKRHMWGVRLFEQAQRADERRLFRSTARRMQRRKFRIKLLQDFVREDINKIDAGFFDSLELSMYHKGDFLLNKKAEEKKYRLKEHNIFNDKEYTDVNFYDEYKTIYHLRKKLIASDEKMDLRLVYLAMHHIIKYRGNFLYTCDFKAGDAEKVLEKIESVVSYITEEESVIDIDRVLDILKDNSKYKREKVEIILGYFSYDADIKKKLKALFKLIVGMKEDISTIFPLEEKKSLRLVDDYDEGEIESLLGENIECFNDIKDINSWYLLQDILRGSTYISQAFIEKYNKYQQDLQLLKHSYKKYLPELYKDMFKLEKEKFVNYNMYDLKKCSIDDLYKKIKSDLQTVADCEEKNKILEKIGNEDFLIRLNNRANGAIPYQLHKIELEKILNNQAQYYSCIEKNKDKILSILSFRIPYYVGPLHNDENQPNNWSIRKEGMEHRQVLPWNFDEIIDKEASANLFIRRMTNKCTYLPDEDVMPRNSLLYSEYCVLNELNNIRCDGKMLSMDEKQLAIDNLFKVSKSVKEKKFKALLEVENNRKIYEIRGFQKEGEFANNLASYIDFTKILGVVDETNYNMIDQIIEWITIFEDKDMLERKIKKEYGSKIPDEQIIKICALNYTGWSRLSKKLLTGIKYENEYNKKMSVMDILKNTNDNFMQIITNKDYGFDKIIKESQKIIEDKRINTKFYEDNIAMMPGSPAIKRGIWQTIKIVDEIVKIMGHEPSNIYVEFARGDEESKRTNTRRAKLQKAYEIFCNENISEINKIIRNDLKNTKLDITDRLYLYYSQNGKCMYSGKPLDVGSLDLYQIDHIIPQCRIKDDSIDNKVLVYSEYNQRKLDGFLDDKVISSQGLFWKKLLDAGLINPAKYYNLINNNDSEKRTEGFIKRQLVETRQITKYATNILEKLYGNSKVFAIKANLVHDFREKYDILKIREMNDYHHAHDAYINSVIGTYINKRYPKMLREFVYSDYIKDFKKETAWNDITNRNKKYGFIVSNMGKGYLDVETGEIIDDDKSKNQIENVLHQLEIRDIYITKKLEEQTGAFYKQNAVSSKKAKSMSNPLEIKEGLNPIKYGSYDGEIDAYSTLFGYTINGKKHMKIEGIPVKQRNSIKNNNNEIAKYIQSRYSGKYENVEIMIPRILRHTLMYKSKKPYYFVNSGEIKTARQLILSKNEQLLLYIALNNKVKSELIVEAYNYLVKMYQLSCGDPSKHLDDKKLLADLVRETSIMAMFDILSEKIKRDYFENIGNNLEQYRDNMLKLNVEEKVKVIKLLLGLTNGLAIDLKLVGGKSSQGRISKLNMNDKWLNEVILVNQSITGMYERKVRINELEDCDSIKQV